MRKIIVSYVLITLFIQANAQQKINQKVVYQACKGFAISKPLSEFPLAKAKSRKEIEKKKHFLPSSANKKKPLDKDPIVQKNTGNKQATSTLANWLAQEGDGTPPDPSGAAGPNHYLQVVNTLYTVYDKTGTVLSGPHNLSSLWSGSIDEGDPIVLYDKYADRWFVTQFQGADEILVAVSTSSNPLGTYYTYTFTPVAGTFPDYPKYSIWSDGYYCTSNIGTPNNVAVFDRIKMLSGDPTAGMISIELPNTANNGFFCPLSADADGQLPPNGTPCPLFSYEDDTWSSGGLDQLNIFKFTTDWTTPTNSSLVLDQSLATQPINVDFDMFWDDVPQPGTSQKLDGMSGVLGFRAQYRRWIGYNSVVLNHSVIVDNATKQVGIRWYELRQNEVTKVWSIYQQSTFAPDFHSRWMGSIAMNDEGSIGIAYAISSNTISPSLRYTGRLASDPLNQFTFAEYTAITGSGAQDFTNRFGDYSQTGIDPLDGLTFWHTGEYVSSNQQQTRVFSFQLPQNAAGIKDLASQVQLIAYQQEKTLFIDANRLANEQEIQIDLFDVMGKLITSKKVTTSNQSIHATINTEVLVQATYLLRIGNTGFQKVIKINIQ